MGDTIYAFARAHSAKLLLSSGTLPAMARTAQRDVPPSWPIATACIVVPMILSFAWLWFVRRFDRAFPEPWWLVLATFGLGGLSVVVAGFLEYALMTASPYLNPSLMTLGGQASAFPVALACFTVVVGLSEEGAKFLGAWTLAAHRREFDEPVDGIVYGAASALGFAAVENIKYFAFGRLSTALILARTFTSIPAHMFFGAIWGYALGKKLVSRKTSVIVFLAWAALMHGAFDTFLSIDGMGLLAMILLLVLGAIFVLLLRRALRHGAIGPGKGEAPPSMARAFFAVGRPGVFALAAIGMLVFSAALFGYGAGHQVMHQKVTYPFLAISSSLVGLVGFCAYGLAATMPLDVAVDDEGVTFAGRAAPWKTILGASFVPMGKHALVRLDTPDGAMTLGPGPLERMRNLERVILARVAR
jgi:RsiW-degrading membrane proteinase PrsW (M82 family)